VSRHHHGWECWAVFADRIAQRVPRVQSIMADDPGLYDAARILGLAIEVEDGLAMIGLGLMAEISNQTPIVTTNNSSVSQTFSAKRQLFLVEQGYKYQIRFF